MASEDSDQLLPGLLAIHCLSDLRNVRETRMGLMNTSINQLNTARKSFEITLL